MHKKARSAPAKNALSEDVSRLSSPLPVTHVLGPLWAVNGRVVAVDAGEDLRRTLLDAVAHDADAAGALQIRVSDGARVTRVVLRGDGSSVAEGDNASIWAGPSATPPHLTLVGVHTGAGATTWAALLGLLEADPDCSPSGQVLLVCRSTPSGINAAKSAIRSLGTAVVVAVLVVADAPGRPVPAAAREQRVLAGAVPVVPVPWLPRLRAVAEISPALTDQLARPVQRITRALEKAHTANKENTR